MEAHVKLGRVAGIEIGLHYSWLIIAFLITLSLAGHFYTTNPHWGPGAIWSAAVVTGILFFAAIVLHELAHSLVAKARGVPVRTITLFALGGVANIERDAGDAKTEFWMGIAGPLASVAIGLVCLGLAWAVGWSEKMTPESPPMAVLVWLGYINVLLAGFNMIPGFPLDGGRVLRAALWWGTGNADRATRMAARVGQVVAFIFILLGLWQFFTWGGFGGLWIAIIGWFLFEAASASYAQVEVAASLRGLRVRDIMAAACTKVDAGTSIQTFAEEYLLKTAQRCFVVEENGRTAGLITLSDMKRIEREKWPLTPVAAVMRPFTELKTIAPDAPVIEALQIMGREDVNQLPVMSKGRLEGIISRSHIFHVLQARSELSM